MTERRTLPLAGIVIALAAGAALILAGVDPLFVAATIVVWVATLWLVQPPPVPAPVSKSEGVELTTDGMRDLIEHSATPMAVLEGNRIIIANAAAREAIGPHVAGQDARVAFRHPAAVDLLNRTAGGSATIQGLTGPQSSWQMTRQPFGERFSLVELTNRTAEVDISRAHTDFVANASHELRTPLASIIGYVETLRDEKDTIDPDKRARFTGILLREARRLQDLVADLMSLSQIEAEKHDQPREELDLVALARRAARDSAGAANAERLAFPGQNAPLIVRGDAKQLEQLVRNLVDNAFKYGRPDSEVSVDLENDGRGMAVLKVRDQGDGIPSEHLPHITRRFYRVDAGRSRAAGGTGLGMAIVKHIVERHRGRLDIASCVGEGTTVTVKLPLAA
jgi:two-component system phosphate regulon sensor histidine kinase PhoR